MLRSSDEQPVKPELHVKITKEKPSQETLNSPLWNEPVTPHAQSCFHRYRTYRTNCNAAGVGFMWWLIQDHPRTTIQNDKDGCRIANNTSNQHVLLQSRQQSFINIPTPQHAISFVFCWYDLYWCGCLIECWSDGVQRQFLLSPLVLSPRNQSQIKRNQNNSMNQRGKELRWLARLVSTRKKSKKSQALYIQKNKVLQCGS